ncbi:hypothetical protein U1E44_03700 [Arenibacter sp. GZD96]|uniref:hypothetical protein n=1 Tax=Aurantibrevibacter litoralis TaxID=3106030 RepID=UPI002AFF72B8|nr:hypothetical protein [Arenibacter sp. GZD-96]MEA1785183.1 hypothetical protein [Arenibacter sp. GZD-96]
MISETVLFSIGTVGDRITFGTLRGRFQQVWFESVLHCLLFEPKTFLFFTESKTELGQDRYGLLARQSLQILQGILR